MADDLIANDRDFLACENKHTMSDLVVKGLTTRQIDSALRHNKRTREIYAGTFPVDLLPRFKPAATPAIVIVNLGSSATPGTHWVLLFFPRKSSETRGTTFLFDSLGNSAETETLLHRFLIAKSSYKFNKIQYQHTDSRSCGYFALAAASLLARGIDPSTLVYYFSKTNLLANDCTVRKIVKREFGLT